MNKRRRKEERRDNMQTMGRIKTIKRKATNITELSEEWTMGKSLRTNRYKQNGKTKTNKKHPINIKWPQTHAIWCDRMQFCTKYWKYVTTSYNLKSHSYKAYIIKSGVNTRNKLSGKMRISKADSKDRLEIASITSKPFAVTIITVCQID